MNLYIAWVLLLIIGSIAGYFIGWLVRNSDRNNYVYQQKEYYRCLQEQELKHRRAQQQEISKLKKTISNLEVINHELYSMGYDDGYKEAKTKRSSYLKVVV